MSCSVIQRLREGCTHKPLYFLATLAVAVLGNLALGASVARAQCSEPGQPNGVQAPAGSDECIIQEIGSAFPQAAITLKVDGQIINNSVVPNFIWNNRTYGELATILGSLGMSVGWEGWPIYRITAERDDLKLVFYLGHRKLQKYVQGILADTITMDNAPFLAKRDGVATNKTVIPVSFVAKATGATVGWDNPTRTVTVTSGSTYFFDWKRNAGGGYSGTYVHYTDRRYQGPMECPAGFQLQAVGFRGGRWCASSTQVYGPSTATMRSSCLAQGQSSATCNSSTWPLTVALNARGTDRCPNGSSFDFQGRYCLEGPRNSEIALGPFPARYRAQCNSLGLGNCSSDRWTKANLLRVVDTTDVADNLSTQQVLDLFASNPELHGVPLENNDLVSAGLFSPDGTDLGNYQLSEAVLPPFVLSGRRQTDSLVRTAYLMLPQNIRQSTAFLLPDKVAQDPKAYIPYIQKKQKAVVIGTFMGPGGVSSRDQPKYLAVVQRHERELFKLRTTLALLDSMNIPVESVLYTVGDTTDSNTVIDELYDDLQDRFDDILFAAGLGHLRLPLSFGGDEMVHVAFARTLGSKKIYVRISNPNAVPRYDGGRTLGELVDAKLVESGLVRVTDPAQADFELHVLAREPQIGSKIASGATRCDGKQYTIDDWLYLGDNGAPCAVDRNNQAAHDASFMSVFGTMNAARRAKVAIADARVNNGSWSSNSVPGSQCDYLLYNGWGTGANNVGYAMAMAKILNQRGTTANIKRLFLEAVAHDVYANGYAEGQRGDIRDGINTLLNDPKGFNHHPGYTEAQADQVHSIFNFVTSTVSKAMKTRYEGTSCVPSTWTNPFKFTAQMWRTFESEVHMWPINDGDLFAPGVYRQNPIPGATKNMQEVLNPNVRGSSRVTWVNLAYLLAE